MTKLPEGNGRSRKPVSLFLHARRTGMFDTEPYDRLPQKSLQEIRDDQRLKGFLKRAVEKDFPPESLINSIKLGIRR